MGRGRAVAGAADTDGLAGGAVAVATAEGDGPQPATVASAIKPSTAPRGDAIPAV